MNSQRIPEKPVVPLPPADVPEVIGHCECGGDIVQVRHELTVEAGGQTSTQAQFDVWCTGCNDGWLKA